MNSIGTCEIPDNGLLKKYASQQGCYTDCFYIDVPKKIALSEFLTVFLTSPVFRLERFILSIVASAPSSINDVQCLAVGESEKFAVWHVEYQDEHQLLMSVADSPIRSWWMVGSMPNDQNNSRLYFGSALLPTSVDATGAPKMGISYRLILSFHTLYSRVLLYMAQRKLK